MVSVCKYVRVLGTQMVVGNHWMANAYNWQNQIESQPNAQMNGKENPSNRVFVKYFAFFTIEWW